MKNFDFSNVKLTIKYVYLIILFIFIFKCLLFLKLFSNSTNVTLFTYN